MAREGMKTCYIIVLIFTIIFAMVEIGLASDFIWHIDRGFIGFGSIIRPRTRYLIFCSSWTILAGIMLLMFMTMADATMAIVTQVIVMFISMIFWLLGAALFTSAVGGGVSCGPGFSSCFVVNIINSTLAFAWINWSFVLIGFLLALWLAFFGRHKRDERGQMRNANVSNITTTTTVPHTTQSA